MIFATPGCAHGLTMLDDPNGRWYRHHADARGADAVLFVSRFTLAIAEPPTAVYVTHRGERFLQAGLNAFLDIAHQNPPRQHFWQRNRRPFAEALFELDHRGDIVPYEAK